MESEIVMANEREMKKALDRLYRYNRLVELGAPEDISENGRKLMELCQRKLSPEEWAEVEARYPSYAEFSKAKDRRDSAWRDRCLTCVHWQGYEQVIDLETSNQWCAEYKLGQITSPQPCPKYKAKK